MVNSNSVDAIRGKSLEDIPMPDSGTTANYLSVEGETDEEELDTMEEMIQLPSGDAGPSVSAEQGAVDLLMEENVASGLQATTSNVCTSPPKSKAARCKTRSKGFKCRNVVVRVGDD